MSAVEPRSVGVIGLGLIGGSLARDLAATGWRVAGADRDAATLAAAREAGVVDLELDDVDPDSLDLLVLAVPVRSMPDWLNRLASWLPPGAGPIVTDTGSTKRSVLAAARSAGLADRFVGSHPIAGDHRSGWSAGRPGLFDGARVWICPTPESRPEAVATVVGLWQSVGGEAMRIEPAKHDALLAHTSHLPQIAATALAAVLDRAGAGPADLGPGGRDVTRLAGSDPEVWLDILLDNADAIVPAVEGLAGELESMAHAIGGGDVERLRSALAAGRRWSDTEEA